MTETVASIRPSRDRPSLPPLVKTLSGASFDPATTRWAFHDGLQPISINFARLAECATEKLVEAMKIPLVWYAENTEGVSVESLFDNFRRVLQPMAAMHGRPIEVIDATLLANFRASLTSDTEWRLGSVSAFLKKWHALGAPGVTDDAMRLLKSIRLKGARKGTAVLTMDPLKGPLTDLERSAIQAALNDGFAAGTIALADYLLAWLCMLLGQRNIQFAMLKVCDVSAAEKTDGSCEYVLRVPRVKQTDVMRRGQFKERLITPSIGKLLVAHANDVRREFAELGLLDDSSQAPLFPQRGETKGDRPDFLYHATPREIGMRISSTLEASPVQSERTGKSIRVTPKRLRHTVATCAAREGHGELIIAELIDHSDTQNVGVYVKATPDIVERIDRSIAIRMAPLARAFAGNIIHDESEALRGDDPTSRIVDPRFDEKMKPMGNCGRNGSCGFMAPISCYTCKNFQAWVEGPHEAVLAYLLTERERLMAAADPRIATVNDRTILAVAEVVRHVREMRGTAVDVC